MNGVVTALRDAVFLASARFGLRQHNNSSFDFEAFDAAYFDASAATRAFTCVHYRHPFFLHVETTFRCFSHYLTMIVPFIHGCGAH